MLATAVLYLAMDEKSVFLLLNIEHNRFLDLTFNFLTTAGDGSYLFLGGCLGIILNKKNLKFKLIRLLAAYGTSALIIQFFKNLIWPRAARPSIVFSEEQLQLVEHVSLAGWKSFPSGHTATAFAVLFILSIESNLKTKIATAILALLIGYSRLYLNQHFMIDIAASAGIGVLTAYGVSIFLSRSMKEEDLSTRDIHLTAPQPS